MNKLDVVTQPEIELELFTELQTTLLAQDGCDGCQKMGLPVLYLCPVDGDGFCLCLHCLDKLYKEATGPVVAQ